MTDVCASCGEPSVRTHNGARLCRLCYEAAVPSWLRSDPDEMETSEPPVGGAQPPFGAPGIAGLPKSDSAFEAMVVSLQEQAAADPGMYRVRVLLLALLGYGFLLGAVLVLGLSAVVIVVILFALRIAFFSRSLTGPLVDRMGMVSRALWVKIPTPEGTPLTAERSPVLFALIEEVRWEARCPKIHSVLVDPQFNASVVHVPRLGVFGWPKHYLVLGLPLLRLLPLEEFKAVLAHEMGHVAGAHGHFGVWVYRQRKSWVSLLQRLEAEKKLEGSVFLAFSRWYAPLFNAHTFVMARAHEYSADALAARVASPRVAADALARLAMLHSWTGQVYFREIEKRSRKTPLPPPDLFGEMARRGRALDPDTAAAQLAEGMAARTGVMDTHPSFSERLAALGESARVPAPFETSAAEELLGPVLREIEDAHNRGWYESTLEAWKTEYAKAEHQRARMMELDAREVMAPLTPEDQWERACLCRVEDRAQEAEAIVEELVRTQPDFATARLAWGMILLARGTEEGLEHLDRAFELGRVDPRPACEAAHAYLLTRGRAAEAERFAIRYQEYQTKLAAAAAERENFEIGDLMEHGLPEETIEALRAGLAEFPSVRAAYLARKRLKHFPESPFLLMGVELIGPKDEYKAQVEALGGRLKLPGPWLCASLALVPPKLLTQLKEVTGGPFYQAAQ